MKILHLTLKKKWFDMIASGEKKEEYREVKPYWINRLTWHEYHKLGEIEMIHALCKKETFKSKFYDAVTFKNGYQKDSPTITLELLDIHYGYPSNLDWIDPPYGGKWYFVIVLGNIIKPLTHV